MVSIKKTSNNTSCISFKGMLLPQIPIRNASDAIQQWGKLADIRYTSLVQDKFQRIKNIEIQKQNFSFLDKLTSENEQKKFIQHFKQITGFPKLAELSKRMLEHFINVTDKIEEDASSYLGTKENPFKIIFRGHNQNSSVGLQKALPGSDLNDCYIVFQGTNDYENNRSIRQAYNEMIDNTIDSRILSFNHQYARPKIFSLFELWNGLDEMDYYSKQLTDDFKPIAAQRLNYSLYQPGESPENYHRYNIAVAKSMKPISRIFARDFAVLIEGIRDGQITKINYEMANPVQDKMNNSIFAWCSNLLQIRGVEQNLNEGNGYKTKLIEREKLKDFDSWPIYKQYNCVKNVIKHMTDDSEIDDEYKKMLTNEDCPIAQSIDALNNNLLKDDLFKQGFFKYFGK